MPSSRESSQPRDQTQVSCLAGVFFITSAPWEAQSDCTPHQINHKFKMSKGGIQFSAFSKAPKWFQTYKQGWEKQLKSLFYLTARTVLYIIDFNLIFKITDICKSLPALIWIPKTESWFIYNQTKFHKTYSQSFLSIGFSSMVSTNKGLKLFLKNPGSCPNKTWICCMLATTYISFTLYLQQFV